MPCMLCKFLGGEGEVEHEGGGCVTKCNNSLLKKVLHADISLSSSIDSCWTSHLLTALDGLAHSDLMRRQMLACDPVNLSQFVVDLRTRHLSSLVGPLLAC
eukprot:1149659-Pelagomonas_calceolata.AAC.2